MKPSVHDKSYGPPNLKKRWQNNTYRYRIRIRFVWQGRFLSPACLTSPFTCILQWRIQGRGPGGAAPLLFLDQTEAQRAGKNFFGDELPLISGSKWPAPPPAPQPLSEGLDPPLRSLRSDVFERRTSTGNGLFAHLSRDFEQIFGQIVSLRIKTLGNTNTVA